MMVLIAGCGYTGSAIGDLLHARGHRVVGLTHSPESAAILDQSKSWRVSSADISTADSLRKLEIQPDVIIHCASSGRGGTESYQRVYVDGMQNLIDVFPDAFPIYTSSTSVYPQTQGETVTETSPSDPPRPTGQLLRQAEQIALEAGGAVARLAGIYGPGRSFVLKNLLLGNSGIEVNESAPNGRIINQIHRDDAASAIAQLAESKPRGVFNVVDDTPLTQRDCLDRLAGLFAQNPPSTRPPDPGRKRGWTHKAVSNAKLRATGWSPRYPSYFDALRDDPKLASSILDLALEEGEAPRAPNIVMVGLMGCGKSTVGRVVAQMLGFHLIDMDALIVSAAGCSIPEIFEKEGEEGFRRRESSVLRKLLGTRGAVISTGGGVITQSRNLSLLHHLGYVVWLEASPALLAKRTSHNNDRPLLAGEEDPQQKLERLLAERGPLYGELADLRIQTDDLSQQETAYGVAESARLYFTQTTLAKV
jgi:shikimate kinase/nucleoside-diphosphate-sugar epimerase